MTRRQIVPLLALTMLGVLLSFVLKDMRPIGRSIGDSSLANLVLHDKQAPQMTYGDGSLTVVIFTDFQCPSCKVADSALQRAIARDGNIKVLYKHWPILGERSVKAAKLALATHRQGIYVSVHRLLMKSASIDDPALRTAVESAGGNWEQLKADLTYYDAEITNQVAADSRDAFALGLQGTPGYLVGSLLINGAQTEREFTRSFKQARAAQ